MRARLPDVEGEVDVDGVRLGYEVHGSGSPTLLLLPTWTIIHARFWKAQVPFLARHFRVITFDGPGNGRADRPTDLLNRRLHDLEDAARGVEAETELLSWAVLVQLGEASRRHQILGRQTVRGR